MVKRSPDWAGNNDCQLLSPDANAPHPPCLSKARDQPPLHFQHYPYYMVHATHFPIHPQYYPQTIYTPIPRRMPGSVASPDLQHAQLQAPVVLSPTDDYHNIIQQPASNDGVSTSVQNGLPQGMQYVAHQQSGSPAQQGSLPALDSMPPPPIPQQNGLEQSDSTPDIPISIQYSPPLPKQTASPLLVSMSLQDGISQHAPHCGLQQRLSPDPHFPPPVSPAQFSPSAQHANSHSMSHVMQQTAHQHGSQNHIHIHHAMRHVMPPPTHAMIQQPLPQLSQQTPHSDGVAKEADVSAEKPKPHSCTTCRKSFSRPSDLRRHERIHSGTRPHSCPWVGCGKAFIQHSALTVHIRVHTGEKPHMCESCSKAFSDSSSLARHRRIHSGTRPYKCPFAHCQKTFTRRTTLTRHMTTHDCSIAESEATTRAALEAAGRSYSLV